MWQNMWPHLSCVNAVNLVEKSATFTEIYFSRGWLFRRTRRIARHYVETSRANQGGSIGLTSLGGSRIFAKVKHGLRWVLARSAEKCCRPKSPLAVFWAGLRPI